MSRTKILKKSVKSYKNPQNIGMNRQDLSVSSIPVQVLKRRNKRTYGALSKEVMWKCIHWEGNQIVLKLLPNIK